MTAADIQDRDGGILLMSTLFGQFPFLRKLFADSAYTGPIFQDGIANVMPGLVIDIVRRSDRANGFVVEPMRWILERTIGWLGRCRRLAKDLTAELLTIEADLSKRCIGLVILSMGGEKLDTRNPTAKLMLTILAGVATWECVFNVSGSAKGLRVRGQKVATRGTSQPSLYMRKPSGLCAPVASSQPTSRAS